MSEHTIFVDTTGITYVEADERGKHPDGWVARYYEIGERAMGYGQSLVPPPAHRYAVLLGQLNREDR